MCVLPVHEMQAILQQLYASNASLRCWNWSSGSEGAPDATMRRPSMHMHVAVLALWLAAKL